MSDRASSFRPAVRRPRASALLAVPLVAACGGNDTPAGDTGPAASCAYTGTANGCIVYETNDCAMNDAYDGVDGGWFDDSGGKLVIELAPNDEGFQIGFEVPDASGLAAAVEYQIPTDVILYFTDGQGNEYQSCAGRLTVTNYEPGAILWGNWGFQARGLTGQCNQVDFYVSQGEFINLEPCLAQ